MVKNLLPKHEAGLTTAPSGKSYAECYDPAKATPQPQYVDFVARMSGHLADAGIPAL